VLAAALAPDVFERSADYLCRGLEAILPSRTRARARDTCSAAASIIVQRGR